jgi:hypothetical protein
MILSLSEQTIEALILGVVSKLRDESDIVCQLISIYLLRLIVIKVILSYFWITLNFKKTSIFLFQIFLKVVELCHFNFLNTLYNTEN